MAKRMKPILSSVDNETTIGPLSGIRNGRYIQYRATSSRQFWIAGEKRPRCEQLSSRLGIKENMKTWEKFSFESLTPTGKNMTSEDKLDNVVDKANDFLEERLEAAAIWIFQLVEKANQQKDEKDVEDIQSEDQ